VSALRHPALRRVLWLLFLPGTLSSVAAASQQSAPTHPPLRVLFLCPHGAAKSVLGAAYFQKLAAERGLQVQVDARGTEPDPTVSPAVAQLLREQGYAIPIATPQAVAPADTASADIVVSMGCKLDAYPAPRRTLRHWDVPGPGENLTESAEAILRNVRELVDELTRR
jgi:arsenate reductase (thioredoxin)